MGCAHAPWGGLFQFFKNIIYLFRPSRRRSWRRRARPWRRQRRRSTPSNPPISPPCGSWGNRRTSSCASWTACCCCSSDGSTLYSRTPRRPAWNRPGASLSRYCLHVSTHWTTTYQTTRLMMHEVTSHAGLWCPKMTFFRFINNCHQSLHYVINLLAIKVHHIKVPYFAPLPPW